MKKIYLVAPHKLGTIAPEIYGHFTELIGGVFYDGLWVGRDSSIPNICGFRRELIEKLQKIRPPVLRWPGGSHAEAYNWRDGIGQDRPTRLSWWTKWDHRYESNAVGTHEFMELCELVGAKAYFAASLAYSTPMEARYWMDYCLSPEGTTALAKERAKNGHPQPFDIPYWGVGNENWGDGGHMRPEFYADEYRRYATLMNNAFPEANLFACGSNYEDFNWTQKVIESLQSQKRYTNGFAMHYYCGAAGDPVRFTEEEWDRQLRQAKGIENAIIRNWNIICGYNAQDKIRLVVDEWGCWHPAGSGPSRGQNLFEQQSTIRDAMVAALSLNIFNNHCEKIAMTNVAQLVNNLHALFLAGGEHCIVTPTYYVYEMFREHQGAQAIETVVTDNDDPAESLSVSASLKDGQLLVTVGNLSCRQDAEFMLEQVGIRLAAQGTAVLLQNDDLHAHNTFDEPDRVKTVSCSLDTAKKISIPKGAVLALLVPAAE